MSSSIKKFTFRYNFKGKILPFFIYIGNPKSNFHPIHYQDYWLIKERGIKIPRKIKESLQKLYKFSQKNGFSFPELCTYAITIAFNNKKQ